MAGGGFKFLLVNFQYLVGWGIIKLVFSMNLFRLLYFESYQCGSLAAIRYTACAFKEVGRKKYIYNSKKVIL
jgi:hypothetical protein